MDKKNRTPAAGEELGSRKILLSHEAVKHEITRINGDLANNARLIEGGMLRRIMQAGASENALCGLFFLVIGACGLWFARDLTYGSLRQMGAGFLPYWYSLFLCGFGAFFLFSSFRSGHWRSPVGFAARPLIFIVGAVASFSFLLDRFGLAAAVLVASLVSGASSKGLSWKERLGLSLSLVAGCVLLFVYLLGQPMKVLP